MPRGKQNAAEVQRRSLSRPSLARLSSRFRARFLGWLGSAILRLQCASWRVETRGLQRLDDLLAAGQRVIVVFWHGKYLPLFALLRGRNGCVFSSDSFRGRVIGEICDRFGYACVLLKKDQHASALDLMEKALVPWKLAAIAVDGPTGPYHTVKPGAIRLAAALGFVVLPVTTASRRKRVVAGRWDRMEVPALFTRVVLVVGDTLQIPSAVSDAEQAGWQVKLKNVLTVADQKAERMLRKQ
jgi:hypothetical protein